MLPSLTHSYVSFLILVILPCLASPSLPSYSICRKNRTHNQTYPRAVPKFVVEPPRWSNAKSVQEEDLLGAGEVLGAAEFVDVGAPKFRNPGFEFQVDVF